MVSEVAALVAAFLAMFLPTPPAPQAVVHTVLAVPETREPAYATVLFGGDMMFDRTIRSAMDREGPDHVFSCIASTLAASDLVVANLEGPITENGTVSLGSVIGSPENFTFTFPTSTGPLLYRHNIRLVNIGNNHILNFGRDGLKQTRRFLTESGVQHFGDPDAADPVAQIDINGISFSFVSYSEWTGGRGNEVLAQIRAESARDRIVVLYAHWGDEYEPPPERVQTLAREFIDAGADIVIGSHPHIVLGSEMHAGKYIYYSLGNLVFDQYWNEEVRTGLLLNVTFGEDGAAGVREIPVVAERGGRTCLKEVE